VTKGIPKGPAPIPTDRPRAAALRVLRQLAAADAPVTIGVLTEALGGHPNTVRAQLAHLVEQGFATEVSLPAGGRGRPALAFAPTLAGRQVSLAEPGRDDHAALVEAVAEQLAATPDPVSAAHDLGRAWGRRIAPAEDGRLFETLGAQGFTPERTADGIALLTCPLLDSALRHPEVVCGMHQGLIDALSTERLELVPFAAPGFCLVHAGDPHTAG
jgi:predicted ArsR family transcriptional regulator